MCRRPCPRFPACRQPLSPLPVLCSGYRRSSPWRGPLPVGALSPAPPLPNAAAATGPPLGAGRRRRPSPRLALPPTGALSPLSTTRAGDPSPDECALP
jgi:hypothetical protein